MILKNLLNNKKGSAKGGKNFQNRPRVVRRMHHWSRGYLRLQIEMKIHHFSFLNVCLVTRDTFLFFSFFFSVNLVEHVLCWAKTLIISIVVSVTVWHSRLFIVTHLFCYLYSEFFFFFFLYSIVVFNFI